MTAPTNDIDVLRQWVGREQVIVHPIEPEVVRRFELMLDREPSLRVGDPLPSMWHVSFFLEVAPTAGSASTGTPSGADSSHPLPSPDGCGREAGSSFLRRCRSGLML